MNKKTGKNDNGLTAAEIAAMIDGEVRGESEVRVNGVESLDDAVAGKVSFLGNPKYRSKLLSSAASVVLVPPDFSEPPPAGRAWVVCRNPSESFSFLVEHFAVVPPPAQPGIHHQAVVSDKATVSSSASVGAKTVLEAEVEIGERTVISPGCYLGYGVKIGRDCYIHPNATIREFTKIGDRVAIHSGAVIGSDGFGYIPGSEGHTKIPQRGIVQIDDDVEIGALVAVDRARFGRTWLKKGVKVDNLVQIAHNVVVGEYSFLVGQAGIAGSSRLGQHVILAGQAGVAGHIEIGDEAVVLGQAGVGQDLPPKAKVMGSPAIPERDYLKGQFNLARIHKLKKELRELKQEVAELREKK